MNVIIKVGMVVYAICAVALLAACLLVTGELNRDDLRDWRTEL